MHTPLSHRFTRLILPLALCALPSFAGAQTSGTPGAGSILRESETVRPPVEPRRENLSLPAASESAPSADAEERLFVPAFHVRNAEPLAAEVEALLAPYVGRSLSMAEIDAALRQVTAFFRARGYPLANAWLPPQDVDKSGALTVEVAIGRYGEVTIQNETPVRDTPIRNLYRRLRPGEAVRHADLERAFLLTSDLAGVALPRVAVRPGQAPGTSDFQLTVPAGKRWQGFAVYDNQGSRYTGRHRLGAGVDLNSPFGLGDKLSLSGVYGHGSAREMTSARLAYAAPLTFVDGLRFDVAVDRTTYELGDQYAPLDATGTANSVEAGLRYAAIRSQDRNLEFGARFTARRLRDEIDVADFTTEKHVRSGEAMAHFDQWGKLAGRALYGALDLRYVWGRLDFDDAEQRAANRLGANTQGHFRRLALDAAVNYALTPRLTLSATVSAQRALGKSLDGSEQLTITGPRGVRAYRESISGDNGYFIDLEARHTLPPVAGLTHALSVFAGTGKVWFERPEFAVDNNIRVSDAGIAYYASREPLFLRVKFAHKIGSQPEERVAMRDGKTH
ncbi:MAG: hypothetical protein LBB51_00360, partial [Zoogloeaceae bacterium]|nr:hypothetical protein [Zoogloeaceae bacterium]